MFKYESIPKEYGLINKCFIMVPMGVVKWKFANIHMKYVALLLYQHCIYKHMESGQNRRLSTKDLSVLLVMDENGLLLPVPMSKATFKANHLYYSSVFVHYIFTHPKVIVSIHWHAIHIQNYHSKMLRNYLDLTLTVKVQEANSIMLYRSRPRDFLHYL